MTNPDDPAFPQLMANNDQPGLTKLEYFAGLAMQGNLMNPRIKEKDRLIIHANAVAHAQALIKELNASS